MRTYTDLMKRTDFFARYRYAKLGGIVGESTFGYDRPLNQAFYASSEWKRVRDFVIVRDNGCDLAVPGREIHDKILVHHMNPIITEDLTHFNEDILNPEFLISVSQRTHNAIHFADESLLDPLVIERLPGDTKLW